MMILIGNSKLRSPNVTSTTWSLARAAVPDWRMGGDGLEPPTPCL